MSTPQDDLRTTVIPQQTVEQPAVTTAPATRRSGVWHRRIPQRIGRARTSTVVIGALFVLLGGLNFVLPQDPYVDVTTEDGQVVRVRSSQLSTTPTPPTTPPAPTSDVPATPTSTPTSTRAPATTTGEDDEETETTAPATTSRSTSEQAPSTTSSRPTTSRAPSTTSRAPSTTAAPEPTEEEQAPEETTGPTG